MEHTKGPWEYDEHEVAIKGTQGEIIAELDNATALETVANARLIATAPELLEALKEITIDLCAVCIAHNPHHKDCTSCPAMDDWRALIAKAERI